MVCNLHVTLNNNNSDRYHHLSYVQAREDNSPVTVAVCGDEGETESKQGKREGEREAVELKVDGLAEREAVKLKEGGLTESEAGCMQEMKEGCSNVISQEDSGADTHSDVDVEEGQPSPPVIRRKIETRSMSPRRNVSRTPVQSESQSGVLQLERSKLLAQTSTISPMFQARDDNSPVTAAVCGDEGETESMQGKREGEREAVELKVDGLAESEAGSMQEMKEGCSNGISQEDSGADTQNDVDVEEGQPSPPVIRRKIETRSMSARRNASSSKLSDLDSQELGGKGPDQLSLGESQPEHTTETESTQGKRRGEREAVKLKEDGLTESEAGSMQEMEEGFSQEGSGADTQSDVDVEEGQPSPPVTRRKIETRSMSARRNISRTPVQSESQSGALQVECNNSKLSDLDSQELGGKGPGQLSSGESQPEHTTHTCSQLSDMDSEDLGGKRPSQLRVRDSMAVHLLLASIRVSKYHLRVKKKSVLGGSERVERPLLGGIGQSRQDGQPVLRGWEESKMKLDEETLSGTNKQNGESSLGGSGQSHQDGGLASGGDGQSQEGFLREKPVLGEGGQENSCSVTFAGQGGEADSRQDGTIDVTFAKQPWTATTGESDKIEPCLPPAKTKEQAAEKRTASMKCGLSDHGNEENEAGTPPESSSDVTTVSTTARIGLRSDPVQPQTEEVIPVQPQTVEVISCGYKVRPEIPLQNRASDRLREKAQLFAGHDSTLLPAVKRRKTLPCKRVQDSSQLSIVDTKVVSLSM